MATYCHSSQPKLGQTSSDSIRIQGPSKNQALADCMMIVKEVKLMALSRGLALHQYLDDWLIRSQSQEDLFIYLGFYVTFNTVQVISQRVVGRAEETSAYSLLGFCTVNCRPTASNYQLSHLRPCRESNTDLRGGRRECYHSATVAPPVSGGSPSEQSGNGRPNPVLAVDNK